MRTWQFLLLNALVGAEAIASDECFGRLLYERGAPAGSTAAGPAPLADVVLAVLFVIAVALLLLNMLIGALAQ